MGYIMRFSFMSFVVMCSGAQQSDICHSIHGTECTDKSVGYKTGVWTSAACCQACQHQTECEAWSWNFKDGDCHLKKSCDEPKPNANYHSWSTYIGPYSGCCACYQNREHTRIHYGYI